MTRPQSKKLFNQAQNCLVGGVNSPVRAFKAVGGTPLFIKKGSGSSFICEDNNQYIDYVLSYGPLILGHAYPSIVSTLESTLKNGTTFGAPTKLEINAAEAIKQAYPYVDKVRFVSSGTEAAMSAIRLARGATKKSIVIKFEGCYHGHADPLLVAAGSGSATLSMADSAGVLPQTIQKTAVLNYNNSAQIKEFFNKHHEDIACVMLEPVTGNMGVIVPDLDFIKTCKECCDKSGALLVFDEVMCGFRAQHTGTHEWIGVNPDIVILGKVIGGGLPCGAYAANKKIMSHIAPEGPVYQAGTLSGNPLAMAAGLATLRELQNKTIFSAIEAFTSELVTALNLTIKKNNLPITIQHKGSMFTIFFSKNPLFNFKDVQQCNMNAFKTFFNVMLQHGIYLPPSQYEACFTSYMHSTKELNKTVDAFNQSILCV